MAGQPQDQFTPIRLIEDQPIDDLERDYLGLRPWATMIAAAAAGTPGPFTIGVHGEWGYGKTTLLRLAKALIEQNRKDAVTVWFNAWQFDREEHPLFPLIAAIADEIEREAGAKGKVARRLTEIGLSLRALTRGMKFKGEVGMPLLGQVGIEFDAEKAIKAEELLGKQTNPLQGEMMYHSAFGVLEKAARGAGGDGQAKIVVFIDDLDRCHPDKAVFLLESIKLILSQPGFVFVMALDLNLVSAHLDKRYLEQCGEGAGGRGRFYMEKIIQLPIEIPSHRSRFRTFVSRTVDALADHHGEDNEAIKALRATQPVLAVGAGTNPRALVRLVNNFLLDCTLWPLIQHDEEYQDLTETIAAALAFNRILQHDLGDSYPDLIANQELCDGIRAMGIEGVSEYSAEAEREQDPAKARIARFSLEGRLPLLLRDLLARPELVEALCAHGQAWLEDERLRHVVQEFAQSERPETRPADFPEPLAKAIRKALSLQPGEPIPTSRLRTILQLDLKTSGVSDSDLVHLNRLSQLQVLDVSQTKVSDGGLRHLAGQSQLIQLNLSGTQVSDAGLQQLKGLSQLEALLLARTSISDAGLEHLKGFFQLQTLSLSGTRISDAGLEHLKGLLQLEILSLSGTRVSDAALEHLKSLSQLRGLWLDGTQVADASLEQLKAFPELHTLSLSATRISDAGLEYLKSLSNLRNLWLDGAQVTDAGLEHLKGIPQLQLLDLSRTQVTSAGLEHLKRLAELRVLALAATEVTDEGLKHLERMSGLRELDVSLTGVTEHGVRALDQQLPDIKILWYVRP